MNEYTNNVANLPLKGVSQQNCRGEGVPENGEFPLNSRNDQDEDK